MNILITGISKGLGKEISTSLKKNGDFYILGTYNKTKVSGNFFDDLFQVDFSKKIELRKFLAKTDDFDIDILINNFHPGYNLVHASKLKETEIKLGFSNYVIPTIEITNHLIRNFKKKKRGIIINILSSYTISGSPKGLSQYIAEKKYIETFNKFWHIENKQFNICSIALSPGIMKTSFHDTLDPRFKEIMYENNKLVSISNVTKKIIEIISTPLEFSGKNILIS